VAVSGKWRITLGDEDLGILDEYEVTLNDALVLEANAGLTVVEMLKGAVVSKAVPMRALVWFMRFKQGNPPHISTIEFKIADLKISEVKDPPKASSKRSATGTSDSSPSTAI